MGDVKEGRLRYVKGEKLWDQIIMITSHHIASHHITSHHITSHRITVQEIRRRGWKKSIITLSSRLALRTPVPQPHIHLSPGVPQLWPVLVLPSLFSFWFSVLFVFYSFPHFCTPSSLFLLFVPFRMQQ